MTGAWLSWLHLDSQDGDTYIATPSSLKISIPDDGIEALFGSYDENLKTLESVFSVEIRTEGHELLITGNSKILDKVEYAIGQLTSLIGEGYELAKDDVRRAAQLVSQDSSVDLHNYFVKTPVHPSNRCKVSPKSINQRRYLDAIEQSDVVFGVGPAGTGKTYLAMAEAVAFLISKRVSRIVLARPAVEGRREARVLTWRLTGENKPISSSAL